VCALVLPSTPPTAGYPLSLQRRSSDLAAFDLGPGQHATTGAGAVLVAAAAADAAGLDACPCLADAEPVLGIALADRGPALFLRRSEEHTSELQSRENLVCRLLLAKRKS